MRDPGHPEFRLRVLRGPLQGAAYLVRDSFLLGRSAACDLVLIDRRVSRLHARVGRDADAGHVLYDLASSNGTRVNGETIRARTLAPRDEIEIGDHRFRYECLPALQPAERAPSALPRPRPISGTRPITDASGTATPTVDPYAGDLVEDVIAYRSLANRYSRGEALELRALARFRALDEAFRDPATPDGFHQFTFGDVARIRGVFPGGTSPGASDVERRDVEVISLGVSGAAIRTAGPILALDDVVHLVFDRPGGGARGRVALVGVAAQVDSSSCRIAFSFGAGFAPRAPVPAEATPPRMQGFRTRSMAHVEG